MKTRLAIILIALFCFQCKSQRSKPEGVLPLEKTYWKLVEVGNKVVTSSTDDREVYMMLTPEGDTRMLTGHAGCNGLGGDYTVDGETVKFHPITTRMYCEAKMDVENLFTQMLSEADRYQINGTTLTLFRGGDLLGKFEANH